MNIYRYLSLGIGELERVRQEVNQYLKVSSLVAVDGLDVVQVLFAVYIGFQFNILVISLMQNNLECFLNDTAQVEIILI